MLQLVDLTQESSTVLVLLIAASGNSVFTNAGCSFATCSVFVGHMALHQNVHCGWHVPDDIFCG